MPGACHPSSASSLPCWDSGLTLRPAHFFPQRDTVGEDAGTAIPPGTTLNGCIEMVVA
jgi:hypothetical protein